MNSVLLSTAYLGPIVYYQQLIHAEEVWIERFEHFQKQTYRNRCEIYGANGKLDLTIPVEKHPEKTYTKDIRISTNNHWQKVHWRSIEAAYRSSPYFEYYEMEFTTLYQQSYDLLFDFNIQLQKLVLTLLSIDTKIHFTERYEKKTVDTDLRILISPKNKSLTRLSFEPKPYTQVFSDRLGFIPNLSILDLLFNEGPHAKEYLR
jgi:hypothetical protein